MTCHHIPEDILHDHHLYFVCPNMLSPVGDPLSAEGVVLRITYSFGIFSFLLVLFIHFILDIKKAC
jgi:hypothetical protein